MTRRNTRKTGRSAKNTRPSGASLSRAGNNRPNKRRCTSGADPTNRRCPSPQRAGRDRRTRRHMNRAGGRTGGNSRNGRNGGGVVFATAAIGVFAAGIGVELRAAAAIDIFPTGIGVELAHAAAHVLAAGIGVELTHAAAAHEDIAAEGAAPIWPAPPLKPPRPASAIDIAPIRTKQAAMPIATARLMDHTHRRYSFHFQSFC